MLDNIQRIEVNTKERDTIIPGLKDGRLYDIVAVKMCPESKKN